MRLLALMFAIAVSACAASVPLPNPAPRGVFASTHGSALAPPAPSATAARQSAGAPPEGVAAGGLDFGRWRTIADMSVYSSTFAAEVAAKTQGRTHDEAVRYMMANGFQCAARGADVECRIEIMEQSCAHDWYAVFPEGRAQPVSGADVMCLGANP
jgi:hypothetical protein